MGKKTKLGASIMLLVLLLNSIMVSVPVSSATASEDALLAVSTAERTNSQDDIDVAQVAVASLETGEERTALETRIDSVQKHKDALIIIDFQDKQEGATSDYYTNNVTTTYVNDNGNIYAKLQLTADNAGGWGPTYSIPSGKAFNGDFTVEQKFAFAGTPTHDRSLEVKLYNSNAKLIFDAAKSDAGWVGTEMEGWAFLFTGLSLGEDAWYNIIYDYKSSTNSAKISVVSVADGTELASTTVNYSNTIDLSTWTHLQYQFGGSTPDNTATISFDDLVLMQKTALMNARDAVVKAERAKTNAEKIIAQSLVSALENGDEKSALQARLDAIEVPEEPSTPDDIENLVARAETTKEQAVIDIAQVKTLEVADAAKRAAYQARLDNVQTMVDALYYINQITDNPLGGWDQITTGTDLVAGDYALIDHDTTDIGKVDKKFQLLSADLFTQPYTIEQKLKISDTLSGGYLYMTGLWGINPAEGAFCDGNWNNRINNVSLTPDVWYNIKFVFDGEERTLYIEDLKTGEVLYTLANATYTSYFPGDGLRYTFDDLSSGKFYVGDTIVTQTSDVKTARKAVVKAERTGDASDKFKAQLLVDGLTGADKEALQNRLDRLSEGLTVGEVTFTCNGKVITKVTPGTITAKSRINNNSNEDITANLIIAVYKGADDCKRLVNIKVATTVSIYKNTSENLEISIDLADNSDDTYEVKAFVWNGIQSIMPLGKVGILKEDTKGLELPNFFTEDMVFQRNQKHNIWGKGIEGKRVNVTLSDATNSSEGSTIVKNGEWLVSLDSLPVGGPYTLKVTSASEEITVEDIYVGDVFLLAGQSNMALTYWPDTCHINNPSIETALASGNIKYFRTHNESANVPTFDIPYAKDGSGNGVEKWQTITKDNKYDLSMIGMYLAQGLIEENPDVPVGLMSVAWGATNISSWTRVSDDNKTDLFTPNDGSVYNNHIAPLTNYNIAAVLWYQGCQDWKNPDMYEEAFPTLINDYRNLWRREDLPFLYVQLARFRDANPDNPQDLTPIREAQRKALDLVDNKDNIGMVVSLDTDKDTYSDIHPYGKSELAQRLLLMVKKFVFEEDVVYSGPLFENAAISGNKIIISFKDYSVGTGLKVKDIYGQSSNGVLKEFEIADEYGVFTPATAVINNNTVEVTIPDGMAPTKVRYAAKDVPVNPNLYNNEDLPASPFTCKVVTPSSATTFCNPISVTDSADPAVYFKDGVYYAAIATNKNRSIAIHKSESLIDLFKTTPVTVYNAPETGMYSRNVWAPELCYFDDTWYIYFTADDGTQANHRMYVLEGTTDDPQDEFTFVTKLETPDEFAIDGYPFIAPDGEMYFIWSGGFSRAPHYGNGIYIAKMSSPTQMANPGSGTLISYPSQSWELQGGTTNEAPAVLVKNNTVHVFFSASTASSKYYCLGRVTCTNGNLLDESSWTKTGPVFSYSDEAQVWGPGSCCFTTSPDGTETWIVYHTKTYPQDGWDRLVSTQRVDWDGEYPVLYAPVFKGQYITVPSGAVTNQ